MYDLSKDIGEQNDLADEMPEKAENLRKKMHAYIDERGGKYPLPARPVRRAFRYPLLVSPKGEISLFRTLL